MRIFTTFFTTSLTMLFTALAFLTRIPVPRAELTPAAIGRSASVFPVVGTLLGAADVGVLLLLRRFMPPTVTATAIVLTGILLTGALHFDGLADTADGFGGGRTREDVLRIMRDHQIGTYGAIALVMAILLRVTAIATLIERDVAERALIVAPTVGRWAVLLLGRWLPYARNDDGLGRALTDHSGVGELCIATALTVAIATLASGWTGAAGLFTGSVATGLLGIASRRRIGGVTGDTLGANAVVCETAVFLVWTCGW